jgi:5-formyltetrahydrofolate cyclo-ligase
MLKKDLRKIYLEKRKTLSKDEVNFLSEKIFEKFILQFNVIENQKVMFFCLFQNSMKLIL